MRFLDANRFPLRLKRSAPSRLRRDASCVISRIRRAPRIVLHGRTVNAGLTGVRHAGWLEAAVRTRKPMDAQRIAVDAIVALTDCDREAVVTFIRRLYLDGVRDPKRLTFKGLQALRN